MLDIWSLAKQEHSPIAASSRFPPSGERLRVGASAGIGRGGQLISNVSSDDVNISDRTGIAVGLGFLDA